MPGFVLRGEAREMSEDLEKEGRVQSVVLFLAGVMHMRESRFSNVLSR